MATQKAIQWRHKNTDEPWQLWVYCQGNPTPEYLKRTIETINHYKIDSETRVVDIEIPEPPKVHPTHRTSDEWACCVFCQTWENEDDIEKECPYVLVEREELRELAEKTDAHLMFPWLKEILGEVKT